MAHHVHQVGQAAKPDASVPRSNPQTLPPPYDPAAVSRITVNGIELTSVGLLGVHFERADQECAIPSSAIDTSIPPELRIARPEWSVEPESGLLGCIFTFAATFPDNEGRAPFELTARFRLSYSLNAEAVFDKNDIEQFVYWSALFYAWPYWNEYLSNTVSRAGLSHVNIPVLSAPLQNEPQFSP
jgi:hypothetical protein